MRVNSALHVFVIFTRYDVFHWCSETKLRPLTHVCSMKACHLKVEHALLILNI